ncbi:hypothetical protein C7N43_10140 [Sphingobacteriales bacterium UPWRP_1]|nr:hypothetical protein B6N25_12245 [Sphingobacteriales bacterium TSM_CSS]PSJ77182.1 hypothetical protein C7N43_10140 [Sphingobacteriales bacterium UPWRP_1]
MPQYAILPQTNYMATMKRISILFGFLLPAIALLLGCACHNAAHQAQTARNANAIWPYTDKAVLVRLYTFNENYPAENETRRPETAIVVNGAINAKATDTGAVSESDAMSIGKIMSQSSDLVALGLSKCFIPRHGLVWYNQQGEPIAHLSVCFECDRIDAVPPVRYTKTHNTQTEWKEKDIAKAEADIAAINQIVGTYTTVKR